MLIIPVLIRDKDIAGGETLKTYEVWEKGDWSHSKTREYLKLLIYFALQLRISVSGIVFSDHDFRSLNDGYTLPVSLLTQRIIDFWHPRDYVISDTHVSKDVEEWKRVKESSEHKEVFEYFDSIAKI